MLEKSTTNTSVQVPKLQYCVLFRLVLQWRHLKMLKCGGQGNHPTSASGTQEGELAILWPSCPHLGINLPKGWEKATPGQCFLYLLILCLDVNFHLKNQLVSNYSRDPGLGIGMSYMVPWEPYKSYVLSCASDADVLVPPLEAHRGFTATVPPEMVAQWEAMCVKWETMPHPRKVKNPYSTPGTCKSCSTSSS